jgi:predicted 3-demethylubiquinone-9 3-methyltransferase (glyoxalase superfamily)
MAQKIIPHLWFNDQAEEAVNFYVSIFKNANVGTISRYGKAGAQVANRPEGSVLTVDFTLEGNRFVALNGGPVFKFTPAISFFVGCDTPEEVDLLFNALSEKGEILMPLEKMFWGAYYASFTDKFGIFWMINYEEKPA